MIVKDAQAEKLVPGFHRVGFLRGSAQRMLIHGTEFWGWIIPDYGLISASLADSEAECTLRALQTVAGLRQRALAESRTP